MDSDRQRIRYRLGLDIGTTSIGWCMVRLDKQDQPIAVIRMGVRIFGDGRHPKTGTSLAVERRLARQMRRRRDRLLKRKSRMVSQLIEFGFWPTDETARKALAVLNPYELRERGLNSQLTSAEFGRAIFHLNQRRGFLSNRKTDSKDNDSGALKQAIKTLREKLKTENCRTIGEWLARRDRERLSVRARLRGKTVKDKAYDFYADRAMVEHEFDTLWEHQKAYNPDLFSEQARNALKDTLLFQRPLKPVRPGRCTLLPDEERAPLALPSLQRFRIYQELNNLRVLSRDLSDSPLSLEQRDELATLLEKGDLTFPKIRQALKLPGHSKFNIEDLRRDRLKGNATAVTMSKPELFGDQWRSLSHTQQDEIVTRVLEESSEATLIGWLTENAGISELSAQKVAQVRLPEGYGSLSQKAVALVLPELRKAVCTYDKAVLASGLGSHSELMAVQKDGELADELPYYGIPLQRHVGFGSGKIEDPPEKRYGRIANPTVHIGLNELRKVVNALIKRYGRPSEIIVEVARELKFGRERLRELELEQAARQKQNERLVQEACQITGDDPLVLSRGRRREYSQKMQLWEELNPDVAARRCPYTGEQISITKLLSAEVEIDHILPYSQTLDDSMNNKTVALRRANRDKGNRSPWQAFGAITDGIYDYAQILERAALIAPAKRARFAKDGLEKWLREDKDFLARALTDTAYLSRVAKEYLSLVVPPSAVRAIPGRMTALLRGKFGLNQLLSGSELKNRNDHRHHALDAAVVAVTDQGLLARFARASASAREAQLERLVEDMPLPWPSYREHVARSVEAIIVSHRPDHGYQAQMMEEKAWGLRESGVVSRRERPEDGGSRTRVEANKSVIQLTAPQQVERHGLLADGSPRPYKGYVGGSNYCIEIYKDESGKWAGDVVSTFDAYQIVKRLGLKDGEAMLRNPQNTQSGRRLVVRLMINDVISFLHAGERQLMRVVKIAGSGQMFFAPCREANVDQRNRDKADPFSYVSKMPGSLMSSEVRPATVSVTGEVSYRRRSR